MFVDTLSIPNLQQFCSDGEFEGGCGGGPHPCGGCIKLLKRTGKKVDEVGCIKHVT